MTKKKESNSFFLCDSRFWFVLLAFLQAFFSSGLIFGWNGLLLILLRENTYSFKCSPDSASNSQVRCLEMDAYLNYIVSVATSLQLIIALPAGILVDKYGPKSIVVPQIFVTVGCVLIGFAEPSENSVDFLFIGLILMNSFSLSIAPAFFHYAHLYPQKFSFISAIMTSSLAISSGLFPVMNVLQELLGVSRRQIFFSYSFIVGAFVVVSIIQPKKKFYAGSTMKFSWRSFSLLVTAPVDVEETSKIADISVNLSENVVVGQDKEQLFNNHENIVNSKKDDLVEERLTTSFVDGKADLKSDSTLPTINSFEANGLSNVNVNKNNFEKQIKQKLEELRAAIFSRYFFVIFVHLSTWGFILLFYLTSVNSQLANVARNTELQNLYTTIFSWVAPLGIIGSITNSFILDKWGFRVAWLYQIFGGIIFCIVILTPVLPLQIIAFFLYTFVQEEVYAISLTFINKYIPGHLFCSIFGILTFFTGLVLLIIPPIVSAILFNGGNFTTTNITFLCLAVISLLTPLTISWEPVKIFKIFRQTPTTT